MENAQNEDLVGQLSNRLEQVRFFPFIAGSPTSQLSQTDCDPQLQSEKTELERAVQEQGDGLALKLRLALLAYEQQNPPRLHHHHRKRSKSRSTVSSSPSSSLSTSASTSSSASFPASPSTQISPALPGPPVDPDVLSALRENESLRVRLANSERVNAYYQRELAELRRRCGISIDELEELDLSRDDAIVGAASGMNGASTRRRHRSLAGNDAPSVGSSSIRIPGASSVSPPAARLSTSSFPFSTSLTGTSNTRFQPQSYASYVSSVNTTLTTPSSSYPAARAPAPTPATSNAFSPVSGPGPRSSSSTHGLHGRRNSLSALVAAALAQVAEAQEAGEEASDTPISAESPTSNSLGGSSRGGIDLEDLLHLSSSPSTSSLAIHRSNGASASSAFSALGHRAPSEQASAASSLSSSSVLSHSSSSAASAAASTDPLVAAITRSLAKLASADSLGQARTSRRLDVEYVDADEADDASGEGEGSGSSSTTSREGKASVAVFGTVGENGDSGRAVVPRRVEGLSEDDADEEDGGETPLSVSPGSRSGSLSRRVSLRLRNLGGGR
ncbi:hypothetical protein JCM11251_004523 [Rhodosporidiobolus azoricus]